MFPRDSRKVSSITLPNNDHYTTFSLVMAKGKLYFLRYGNVGNSDVSSLRYKREKELRKMTEAQRPVRNH